jgi:hypothetical protein
VKFRRDEILNSLTWKRGEVGVTSGRKKGLCRAG